VAVREAASIDLYCSLGKERNPQRHGFLGNRSNPEGMLPGFDPSVSFELAVHVAAVDLGA
jgi:hypothetical protein